MPISLLALTTITQWTLFFGIALIIFGSIEKKDIFVLSGQLAFLFLGFLSLYMILSHGITVPENNGTIIPKEQKVLALLKGVSLFSGLTAITLLFKFFRFKYWKQSTYILILVALFLFFMVFNIQQMA